MKYDCSKTLDYAHERNRMCDAVKDNDCDNCKLQGVGGSCFHAYLVTQEHIDIVQKWSDEHPEMTRIEVDKLFGKDIEVDELFGRFIVAFEFMDAEWRRCALQFLTAMNDQLLEEKND